jgi:hypothetical protein
MADSLDNLRRDALHSRVKGAPGGNRVLWSPRDIGVIRDHIASMPERIIRAAPTSVRKIPDLVESAAAVIRKFVDAGIVVNRDMQSSDLNFLYIISSQRTDLSNDDIDQAGIDCEDYKKTTRSSLIVTTPTCRRLLFHRRHGYQAGKRWQSPSFLGLESLRTATVLPPPYEAG